MTKEILLQIDKDIHIAVIGEYFEEEEDVNIPPSFEIDSIESIYKDILPFVEWVNSKPKGEILEYLEQMCLEKC